MTPDRPRDPFFIIGTGRCGTTLLQAMLSAHPGLYVPPETHFFFEIDPVALGFDDPVPDCDVQGYILAVTERERWARLMSHTPNPGEVFADAVHSGTRSSRDLFGWVLNALTPPELSHRRLGEKSPHHEKYTDRIVELYPEARFIHLRRDPRDVTEALLRMRWWTERSTHRTAVYWARVHDRAIRSHHRLGPERHLVIRYEDLVQAPRTTLESVCEFLGEPFHEAVLTHDLNPQKAFDPRESPHKGDAHQRVSTAHVQKYQGRLSDSQIRVIERAVGPRLAECGYTPDESVRRFPLQPAMKKIDRVLWKLTGR